VLDTPQPESQPNWDEVASRWIDLIRPIWHEKIKTEKVKLLLMKDIRKALIASEPAMGDRVLKAFMDMPTQRKPDERIKACIIGVPK
jgi:hypothetical protein